MKIVAGLGNPGSEYDATRHNVGWWVLDRICSDWGFGGFRREGAALVSEGNRGGIDVLLAKPAAYMNRSGPAMRPWLLDPGFDPSMDLLVVLDDAALEVGRVRLRARGSAGGHNGLRSIGEVLGSGEFARLRVGVGHPPPGIDLVSWVLSSPDEEDEDRILELLPRLGEAVDVWLRDGIEAAMNGVNR